MRKDYFRDLWTIIANGRSSRPQGQSSREKEGSNLPECFFCPGNEDQTPPEITRISAGDGWQIRVFPNKFPIIKEQEEKAEKPWKSQSLKGAHEIVVETPHHFQKASGLGVKELKVLMQVFAERIKELEITESIQYVEVFKNQGVQGGASLPHSHFQIIALNKIPPRVQEKINNSYQSDCTYCHIADNEEGSKRKVFENNHFIAFCPYAPQYTHELWIVAKKHLRSFKDFEDNDFLALAEIFKNSLEAVDNVATDYNVIFNVGPKDDDFHFHIEICPRFEHAKRAGFELGTDIAVVTSAPEESARIYRGES